jgi:hypothetical protein
MFAADSVTRVLALPLIVAALAMSVPFEVSRAAEAGTNIASGRNCCGKIASPCCGSACCRMPADQSERSPSNPADNSSQRAQEGKLVWSAFAALGVAAEAGGAALRHFSGIVSTSGSPSLIAEHVRLQI